jgi:hypothetical protein
MRLRTRFPVSKKKPKKANSPAKKTPAKKKASKKKATKKKMPARRRPPAAESTTPQWGRALVLGSIDGSPVEIPTPMNMAAIKALSPLAGVALVMHERMSAMEDQIRLMQRDLDLHNRLSRLEAAAAED